jgi:hypothetical protein
MKRLFGTLLSAGLVLIGLSAYSIDQNNILVHWSFDELDGDIFKDESGNGHDGRLDGDGELVDGRINKAVHLTGGYVTLASGIGDVVESVGDTGEITMEASIFLSAHDAWDGVISIGEGDENGPLEGNRAIIFRMMVSPDLDPYWNIGFRADHRFQEFVFELDTWYHYVITGDSVTSKIYINGELIVDDPHTNHAVPENFSFAKYTDVFMFVGAGEASHVWRFEDAIVDEVAIYNKVLTEGEINDLMVKGLRGALTAVDPQDKLASRWGEIKAQRHVEPQR